MATSDEKEGGNVAIPLTPYEVDMYRRGVEVMSRSGDDYGWFAEFIDLDPIDICIRELRDAGY